MLNTHATCAHTTATARTENWRRSRSTHSHRPFNERLGFCLVASFWSWSWCPGLGGLGLGGLGDLGALGGLGL